MSDELFATRLWFYAGRGAAKLYGRRVPLLYPPVILGQQLEQIDYCPEAGTRILQPATEKRRDMTPAEIKACDAFLLATVGV